MLDHQIPLVDHKHTGLVVLFDVLAQLFVHLADLLAGIEKQQHHVGPADAALRPVEPVVLNVLADALAAADARGVDRRERLAVHFESDVDAVARGSRHLADDHPLVLDQRVDERAFADVAPPDDRHFHFGRLLVGSPVRRRQLGQDGLEQLVLVPVLLRADAQHVCRAQPIELVRLRIELRSVGFVRDEQHRTVDQTQPPGDFLVQGDQSAARVQHEYDHIRLVQSNGDLLFDLVAQVVDVVDADAACVDQLETAVPVLDHIRHPVASHPGHVVDNGQASTGEPVEDTGLADVRPAHNDYLRNAHLARFPPLSRPQVCRSNFIECSGWSWNGKRTSFRRENEI